MRPVDVITMHVRWYNEKIDPVLVQYILSIEHTGSTIELERIWRCELRSGVFECLQRAMTSEAVRPTIWRRNGCYWDRIDIKICYYNK